MSLKIYAVLQSNDTKSAQISKKNSVTLKLENKTEKSFHFDGAYQSSNAEEINNHLVPLIQNALSGFNQSVVCFGTPDAGMRQVLHGAGFSAQNGIGPSLINEIFQKIGNTQCLISASMLQINHKGELFDLLNPHQRAMTVKQNNLLGTFVEELSSIVCSTAEEMCSLYTEGYKVESTLKSPSRDVIFTIYIATKQPGDLTSRGIISKVSLFDLSGREAKWDSYGIKSLFKSLGKGKGMKETLTSPTSQLLWHSIVSSANVALIPCIDGEDINASVQTLEMAKSASGAKLSPHQSSGDLETILTLLRKDIKVIRDRMMTQNPPQKKDISQLEQMLSDLSAAKKTSWEHRISLSNQFVEERKTTLANRGLLWVLESNKLSNHEEIKELQKDLDKKTSDYKNQKQVSDNLKDNLKSEIDQYKELVASGKTEENDTKSRIVRIQQMKDQLKSESEKTEEMKKSMKNAREQLRKAKEAGLDVAAFNFEMTLRKLEEDRNKMKKENQLMLDEEMEKMKAEVEQDRAELEMRASSGDLPQPTNEEIMTNSINLATMTAEKGVVTLQIDILKKENRQLEEHLRILAEKHSKETEIQQLQNLQTFRAYREVFEEFKVDLENRWRGLLDDAIQDAVFLNSRNNELTQENLRLKNETNELKDSLSLTGMSVGKKSVEGITET